MTSETTKEFDELRVKVEQAMAKKEKESKPYYQNCPYKGHRNPEGKPMSQCAFCKAQIRANCHHLAARLNENVADLGPDFRPQCKLDNRVRCGVPNKDCSSCSGSFEMHPWILKHISGGNAG